MRRNADTSDRRREQLVITEDGKDLLSERREACHGQLASMIATRMDKAERDQLTNPCAAAATDLGPAAVEEHDNMTVRRHFHPG